MDSLVVFLFCIIDAVDHYFVQSMISCNFCFWEVRVLTIMLVLTWKGKNVVPQTVNEDTFMKRNASAIVTFFMDLEPPFTVHDDIVKSVKLMEKL